VFLGEITELDVRLDGSWERGNTQADLEAAFVGGAGEREVDGGNGALVDGSADVEEGAGLRVLAKGTTGNGVGDGEQVSRDKEGRGKQAASETHGDKERIGYNMGCWGEYSGYGTQTHCEALNRKCREDMP